MYSYLNEGEVMLESRMNLWSLVFAQSMYPPPNYLTGGDQIAHASKMADRALKEFDKRFSRSESPDELVASQRAA